MIERPYYFRKEVADEAIQAILAKRMTQLRVPVKGIDTRFRRYDFERGRLVESQRIAGCWHVIRKLPSPFGAPGTILAVKEALVKKYGETVSFETSVTGQIIDGVSYGCDNYVEEDWVYRADGERVDDYSEEFNTKREFVRAQHMPLEFVRMRLRVERVWAERVQEISEADAKAEGVSPRVWFAPWGAPETEQRDVSGLPGFQGENLAYRNAFATSFDRIYAKRGLGWDANPWAWACEFEMIEAKR